MSNFMEKNIIYQTEAGEQTDFELEYIDKFLFGKIRHTNVFNYRAYSVIKENPIVVFSNDSKNIDEEFKTYLKKLNSSILFHLSNEKLNHNADYYRAAQLVFRAYWDPNITSKNVYTLPLGFKAGFFNDNKAEVYTYNREIVWAFFGQLKSDRKEMCDTLKTLTPNYIHITSGWSSEDQKSVSDIIAIYKKSTFIPCPFGNVNPDSFRIMECLEYGCIPVAIKFKGIDYFQYIYGDHPFIVGATWNECRKKMELLLTNKDALKKKQLEVIDWYKQFCDNLTDDIESLLAGDLSNLKSHQFRYQKQAKNKLLLRLKFYNYFTIKPFIRSYLRK
jgi:hypothetical protein